MTLRITLILSAMLLAAQAVPGQTLLENASVYLGDAGTPYQEYFSPKVYRADAQNWAMVQRPDGVMIIGNGDGILTFDGAVWTTTPIANNNLVRCLAQGPNDKIYIGGYNEIGFIDYSVKNPRYESLVAKLPAEYRELGNTWNVTTLNNEVYFSTDRGMFRWKGEALEMIDLGIDNSRAFATSYKERILVQALSGALTTISGNVTKEIKGGAFYRGKRITSMFSYDDSRALVATIKDGLFLYDGETSKPFATHLLGYFSTNQLYRAIKLQNGNMAFATLQKGVVVLNPQGEVVQFLDKDAGLGDNIVYNLLEDREGALWTALSVGLSRTELESPMSLFGEKNGLDGAVNDIVRFEGKIYVATMLGLFELNPATTATAHATFRSRPEIHSSAWALTVAKDVMLVATDNGTMAMKDGSLTQIDQESGAVLLHPEHHQDLALVGLADGVNVLHYNGASWVSEGRIDDLTVDVGEISEDLNGDIWLGTFSEGAIRLSPGQNQNMVASANSKSAFLEVSRFGSAHGLPAGYVQINNVGGELAFRSEPHHTLYAFDDDHDRFEPFTASTILTDYDSSSQHPLSGERAGALWLVDYCPTRNSYDLVRYAKSGKTYQRRILPFARVKEDFDEVIYEEANGIVWMGGLDGVLRYDLNIAASPARKTNVILNDITVGTDSLVHRGVGTIAQGETYPYQLNSIAFSFAATSFDLLNGNQYQYLLENFDDNWSPWTNHTSKSYTQIPEGDYVFKVRARDVYGNVSLEATYRFTVRPPWYRHPFSFVAYTLGFIALIIGAVKIRSRKLERDNVALTRIIEERTVEISSKNFQLNQQAKALIAQTEKLKEADKVKSTFFTNISHEFRTPLSLILAPLEKQISEGTGSRESELMFRNGKRLQRMINQLLELSKVEAGEMKLFLSYHDLASFARSLVTSFEPLAERKDIALSADIPVTQVSAYFDLEKVETILYNLLSNAIKFTPSHGHVHFSMMVSADNSSCEFIVTDSGMGIDHSCIDKIFDRFYQVESGTQRAFEGSGIGLALTKELVELMQGTVTVDSSAGKGSSFRIRLPLSGKTSTLVPGDIATEMLLATNSSISSAQSPVADELKGSHDATILLVEDNEDLVGYLYDVLEKHFRVQVARDGEEALTMAHADVPDLILSDMMMPGMDGFTLCQEIRKDTLTSHVPFILLTAKANIESRLAGLELGADDYLTKPFIVAELLTRIKNLLYQRKQLQARFRQELTIAPLQVTVTSADKVFIRKVMETTEAFLGDATFSVDRLSEELGISRKHLHRKLVALIDQTPNEFIRLFRLKRAMQLLQQQSGSVKQIAHSVGFTNLSYFAKCFKDEFKISPTEVTLESSGLLQV